MRRFDLVGFITAAKVSQSAQHSHLRRRLTQSAARGDFAVREAVDCAKDDAIARHGGQGFERTRKPCPRNRIAFDARR